MPRLAALVALLAILAACGTGPMPNPQPQDDAARDALIRALIDGIDA